MTPVTCFSSMCYDWSVCLKVCLPLVLHNAQTCSLEWQSWVQCMFQRDRLLCDQCGDSQQQSGSWSLALQNCVSFDSLLMIILSTEDCELMQRGYWQRDFLMSYSFCHCANLDRCTCTLETKWKRDPVLTHTLLPSTSSLRYEAERSPNTTVSPGVILRIFCSTNYKSGRNKGPGWLTSFAVKGLWVEELWTGGCPFRDNINVWWPFFFFLPFFPFFFLLICSLPLFLSPSPLLPVNFD